MNTYRGWRLLSELPGVSFQKRNIRVLRHGIHVGRLLGAKKVKITGCQVWWIGLIGVTAAIWNPEFVSRSDGVEWGRESSCCWHTQQTTTNQAVFLEFLALAGNEAHHCAVQCSFFFYLCPRISPSWSWFLQFSFEKLFVLSLLRNFSDESIT